MKSYFQDLYAYHDWANQAYFSLLSNTGNQEVVRLYSHILNAHAIWMNRILGQPMLFGPWHIHAVADMPSLHQQFQTQSLHLIAEETDFSRTFSYQNSKGQAFTNSLRDTLAHVVNHGTYHRGQVAWLLREEGIAPPSTDYIFYKR